MVVTVTMTGYIKRTPLALFREQKRGGKGRSGMTTKDEDAVTNLFVTSTHNPVLFFSNLGRRLPDEGLAAARGRPQRQGPADGQSAAAGRGRDDLDRACRCPRTRKAGAACTSCSPPPTAPSGATAWPPSPTSRPPARSRCASASARATRSEEEGDPTDRLIGVELLTEEDDVLLATRNGKAIRFKSTDVREFQSRTSTGVRGVRLQGRRRGHLDVDPAPRRHHPGRARGLSQMPAVARAARMSNARFPPSAMPSWRRRSSSC